MTELLAVLLQAQPRPGGAAAPTTSATPPIYGYIPIVIFFLIAVWFSARCMNTRS